VIVDTRQRLFILAAILATSSCGRGEESAPEAPGTVSATATASPDPCGLLTRAEAEAVLGSLVAEPYRTKRDTAVADSGGPGCAYSTPGGKALLVTPEWTYGKMVLDTERLLGGLVRQMAQLPGPVADTLEGLWDDAVVGLSGELLLRKGARALTIHYVNSSTDAAGAVRLSGTALARLAAVPEPARAEVSSDGCPLAPDLVSTLLEKPVRLTPRPVRLIDACSYQLVEDPTVEVELSIKPAAVAEMLFDGLQARARGMVGPTGADSLTIGETGWAYGSTSGSEAAARKGERVFHAVMAYPLGGDTPGLKDAMVRLVAAMLSES
jgi:hypothetical protein